MNRAIEDRVREEIEGLHLFFVGWFSGKLAEGEFDSGFLRRFSEDLVFIPPAGRLLHLDDLSSSVRAGYASNPSFRIQIRNVQIQRQFEGFVLATYEEWQRNALASKPSENGRLASVLFSLDDPLQWLHIHETWLPEEVQKSDAYDF